MFGMSTRPHFVIAGATPAELGASRGSQLATLLPAAYAGYAELFRRVGIAERLEREIAQRVVEGLDAWRPELVEELEGIAGASGLPIEQVVALNARTEVLSNSPSAAARECSTIAATIGGVPFGVQTWDWHVELRDHWHTQEVVGPGHRFVGLTESGIVSKIGMNAEGLALHFNILGHRDDRAGGVPMHVLSSVVLSECATVSEAVALIRSAPVQSSSAFTLIDVNGAVSVEMSPAGVREIPARAGSVVRTNHFIDAQLAAGQKSALYEPDSSERHEFVSQRLHKQHPTTTEELVALLHSGAGEPPLCCVPDMQKGFGDRWATLSTVVSDPAAARLSVLDGMPSEAGERPWRVLRARDAEGLGA